MGAGHDAGVWVLHRTANGVVQKEGNDPERFWPTATGALTTASMMAATDRCTSLLAEHASKLLLIRGINYPNSNGGCAHAQGIVQRLTSSKPSGGNNTATSTGVSVDTVISQQVNPKGVDPLTLYSGMKRASSTRSCRSAPRDRSVRPREIPTTSTRS